MEYPLILPFTLELYLYVQMMDVLQFTVSQFYSQRIAVVTEVGQLDQFRHLAGMMHSQTDPIAQRHDSDEE